MLIQPPLVLPNRHNTLYLPQDPSAVHSLQSQMSLLLCHLSGNICKVKAFHRQPQTSSCSLAVQAPGSSTALTLRNGWSNVVNGKIIPFHPLVASGLNFLAELYNKGLSYSALNTARSALANVIALQGNQPFGNHPLVS